MKVITGAQYDTHESEREIRNRKLAYRAAVEGIVLLKNDGALPLKTGDIALYGGGARHTIKGGSGSGEVNERYSATIYDGLKEKGFRILTDKCLERYDRILAEAKESFDRMAKENYTLRDIWTLVFTVPAPDAVREEDLVPCDTAIYVVARQSGEGKDRRVEGNFKLEKSEVDSLELLSKHYEKVILVINSGSSVDLSDVEHLGLNAVIFFCQQGLEGGRALASLLTGEENFSGKLADTWMRSYDDVPFGGEFSYLNGDLSKEYYREGIYVGYRYYDTFRVPVRYHFGYGLSYTGFEIGRAETSLDGKEVSLDVPVKNTGSVPGEEVVQVYVSCPRGRLDKEYQRLVAFGKTMELAPGETEVLRLSFGMDTCSSYDQENDLTLLESGDYVIRVGNSSADTVPVALVRNGETVVLSKHARLMPCHEEFEELRAPAAEEEDTAGLEVLQLDPGAFETVVHEYPKMEPVRDRKVRGVMEKLTLADKVLLTMGEADDNEEKSAHYIYTPGSVARSTEKLVDKGVININLADGPAGLRLLKESALDGSGNVKYLPGNYPIAMMELFVDARPLEEGDTLLYQYPTAWPVATALAQSFSPELMEKIGRTVSEEMVEFNVTYLLAPGMNIHRNPLCGRNFEYYSEDPVLSGKMAAAFLKGVQSIPGNYITIKHFACNNAEDNRSFTDSVVHGRALREIYLKGFEIAVKEGHASGLMTSYNRINGVYAANNHDLTVDILRNEWGFDGVVMTDWTSTIEGQADNVAAIKTGHILMPGGSYYQGELWKGLESGSLTEEELDIPVSQFLRAILYSNVASRIRPEDVI